MKKKIIVSAVLVLSLVAAATGCGSKPTESVASEKSTETTNKTGNLLYDDDVQKKISEMQRYINAYFYFEEDEEKQKEAIYKAVMSGLDDPDSEYYTPEEYAKLMEDTSGVYVGIGAVVTQDSDGVVSVVRPIKGSPAEEAGVLAGDIIVQVGDMEINGQDLQTVVNAIRGDSGTEAYLKIYREGEKDYLEFNITRREVENFSVEYKMLDDSIGYIQITEFIEKTAPEFEEAVNDLLSQGAKGFIFDLRDNPGGLVSAVTRMVSYLSDETKSSDGVVMYTEDKNGKRIDEYKDTDGHKVDVPMVVLANGNSASASEIFSGSLRDLTGAKLIGTTTFGKGIVQSVIPLSDGSGMKITIAKYFIPSGYDLHKVGLEPDIEVELPDGKKNAVNIDRKDDTQLDKAIEVLTGK